MSNDWRSLVYLHVECWRETETAVSTRLGLRWAGEHRLVTMCSQHRQQQWPALCCSGAASGESHLCWSPPWHRCTLHYCRSQLITVIIVTSLSNIKCLTQQSFPIPSHLISLILLIFILFLYFLKASVLLSTSVYYQRDGFQVVQCTTVRTHVVSPFLSSPGSILLSHSTIMICYKSPSE